MRFLFVFLFVSTVLNGQGFKFKGLERTYIEHIPKCYSKSKNFPLVIALHGGGGKAKQIPRYTGFNELSERDSFIVVYPDAYEHHWNDGRECDKHESQKLNIDDVGFISALIDTMIKKYSIDTARIFVTGLSNGGMMSFRLGIELGKRIKAIAPVIASIPEKLFMSHPKPAAPMNVLIINGTGDPLVPYDGGDVRFGKNLLGRVVGTKESAMYFVRADSCDGKFKTELVEDKNKTDGSNCKKETYTGCSTGKKIIVITVFDGGHTMPGKKQYAPKLFVGKTNQDFDGAEEIVKFFKSL